MSPGILTAMPASPGEGKPARPVAPNFVLQAFNTWAFKREQPTEPELLAHTVASAVARLEPISFVLYWGKGPRSAIAKPEAASLDYLAQMTRRIEGAYPPGAAVTLIMTDTHALHNGHGAASIGSYFGTVAAAALERGFKSRLLSEIVAAANVDSSHADWRLAPDLHARLQVSAAKWYRGDATIKEGAEQYYAMNMIEKRAIETVFPQSIFVTFNGSEFRELFPEALPAFYMYSIRKGVSVKPWFEEPAAPDTTDRPNVRSGQTSARPGSCGDTPFATPRMPSP